MGKDAKEPRGGVISRRLVACTTALPAHKQVSSTATAAKDGVAATTAAAAREGRGVLSGDMRARSRCTIRINAKATMKTTHPENSWKNPSAAWGPIQYASMPVPATRAPLA